MRASVIGFGCTVLVLFTVLIIGKAEIYIVTVEGGPSIGYKGGIDGFKATAVESDEKIDTTRDSDDVIISQPLCDSCIRRHYIGDWPDYLGDIMTCVLVVVTFMFYVRHIRVGVDPHIPVGIPTIVFHDMSDVPYNMESCCFCLCDFVGGDQLVSLPPCRDVFHRDCIAPYLALASTCPYCQGVISVGDD